MNVLQRNLPAFLIPKKPLVRLFLLFALLIGTLWLLYLPGINGGIFFFDDNPNLSVLGELGTVDSWQKLFAFLGSGIAGPTGRPISLLSFLMDGHTWPTNPYPFLRSNTLIHGLNACLLFICLWQVARRAKSTDTSPLLLALIATALWALHPYWVSTVLYAVQRMALLSTFFVLAGLNGYLWGRALTLDPKTERKGWLIAIASGVVGTILATLSKENGALMPVYILVLETIVVRQLWLPAKNVRSTFCKIWHYGLLLYLLAIVGYLGYAAFKHGLFEQGLRPYTPYERLLTEPRILFHYLYDLLIPQPGYPGLFYDDYPFSTGLFSPPQTLLAILGLTLVMIFATVFRQRWPWFSLAIWFFLAGHLIESTVLPLELAFEHRNYMPATFLFLPVALGLLKLPAYRKTVTTGCLLALMLFTHQHAKLWGKPVELGVYWALKNPNSDRATILATGRLRRAGQHQSALSLLEQAVRNRPRSPALNMTLLWNRAILGIADEKDVDRAIRAIQVGPYDPHLRNMISPLVDELYNHRTGYLRPADVERVLTALEQRTDYAAQAPIDLRYEKGRIALSRHDIKQTCRLFAEAARQADRVSTDLQIMSTLATRGFLKDARFFLDQAKQRLESGNHKHLRFTEAWYRREFQRLSSELTEEERKHGSPPAQCNPA